MNKNLSEMLTDYVQDAHAMEENVLLMLNSMILSTKDPEIRGMLEAHREETQEHVDRLAKRLREIGEGGSLRKQTQALGAAMVKGLTDQLRSDKAGKNARDGFVTEHLEIAAYELLERLAKRAGDRVTARIAAQNRADEERMARRIAANWDRFLDLTLDEEGVAA